MPRFHEPIYRPIIREAFRVAWTEQRYWPVAIFAGILLSGSVYDVIWKALNAIAPQATLIGTVAVFSSRASATWSQLSTSNLVIGGAQVLVVTLFALVIGFAIFAASVIAQSALVFAVGTKKPQDRSIRTGLAVGARALWPVFALNLIAMAVLFASRALIALALSFLLAYGGGIVFLAYLLSFILFTGVGIATVIVEILALNAMILQGATLAQAIERGLVLLKQDWVTALETAAILFAISFGALILLAAVGMIITFAFIILFLLALATKLALLASIIGILYFVLIAAFILALFGFIVLVHYAAWSLLYRRLGEGGVLPKLHRIVRSWVHSYKVKGA
jgi:hypothetical protein